MTLSNMSALEAAHVVLCTVGVVGSAWCCWDAFADWLAVRRHKLMDVSNPDRAIRLVSAWMCVRIEGVRILVLSFYLYLGILAASAPPPTQAITTRTLFIRWCFIGMTVLLVINSVLDVRARRRIMRYIQSEQKTKLALAKTVRGEVMEAREEEQAMAEVNRQIPSNRTTKAIRITKE